LKSRLFILRCTAVFLLLVFSQKSGVGLFLHTLFHNNVADKKAEAKHAEESKNRSYACSCVEDLLMPFTEAEEQHFPVPARFYTHHDNLFDEAILTDRSVFSFLRGPPARLLS
jgi:hypothetical protein